MAALEPGTWSQTLVWLAVVIPVVCAMALVVLVATAPIDEDQE